MPFKPELKEIYTEVYVPVCEKNGFKCWRVDEISKPGSITKDIVDGILDADVVIADLTGKNANVFYELGIAHCAGNKTIMTAQSSADVPFDIANYRVIFYEQTISGCKDLAKKLDAAIKELLAALDRTNNPFQEAVASRGGIRVHRKTPLTKFVNLARVNAPLRSHFQEKGIFYVEDLPKIDLTDLPGVGRDSRAELAAMLVHADNYDDVEGLQKFIAKQALDIDYPWKRIRIESEE